MDLKNVIYEKKDHLAIITIDRPERRNAIDTKTNAELRRAFEAFCEDDDTGVAIVTGAGDTAFSAGADLVELAQSPEPIPSVADGIPFAGITRDFRCWKPIIAAINGYCLAGGLELALACDIRVASEGARFGLMEPKRALIPSAGGTQRLPRVVPMAFAMEVLLTGDGFDAQTALRFGLISRVVPSDRLMAVAEEIASSILECGPLAVRAIKKAVIEGRDVTLEEGLRLELQIAAAVEETEDSREGPTAFAQKRKPQYKGR